MELTLFNFTGLYETQRFYGEECPLWLDCRHISGTNCYCDSQAERELLKLLKKAGPEGIHFLESGNYHYMTKLWTDLIEKPFELVIFDQHTDMLPPAFGEILSCGGWLYQVLVENPMAKRVLLAGPPEKAWQETISQVGAFEDKLTFISRERLADERAWSAALEAGREEGLPLYISLDKDVLAPSQVTTNWDQGIMEAGELENRLEQIVLGRRIIGWDLCGEGQPEEMSSAELEQNEGINRRLLEWIRWVWR